MKRNELEMMETHTFNATNSFMYSCHKSTVDDDRNSKGISKLAIASGYIIFIAVYFTNSRHTEFTSDEEQHTHTYNKKKANFQFYNQD